jgi:hypothetical protein
MARAALSWWTPRSPKTSRTLTRENEFTGGWVKNVSRREAKNVPATWCGHPHSLHVNDEVVFSQIRMPPLACLAENDNRLKTIRAIVAWRASPRHTAFRGDCDGAPRWNISHSPAKPVAPLERGFNSEDTGRLELIASTVAQIEVVVGISIYGDSVGRGCARVGNDEGECRGAVYAVGARPSLRQSNTKKPVVDLIKDTCPLLRR